MRGSDAPLPSEGGRGGAAFWIGAVVGAAVVAFGVFGLLANVGPGIPSQLTWLVAGALAMDLVVVPIAAVVGLAGRRAVPPWAWPALRFALVSTAVLAVFSVPLIAGWGGTPGNPSVRPRNYTRGLIVAVAATWVLAGVAMAASGLRERRRPAPSARPSTR